MKTPILILGLVFLLLSPAYGQFEWIADYYVAREVMYQVGSYIDYNFENLALTSVTVELDTDERQEIELRTYNKELYNNQVLLKFHTKKQYNLSEYEYEYEAPEYSASVEILCNGLANTQTVNLSDYDTWMSYGFADTSILMPFGAINQTIPGGNESLFVTTSQRCVFIARNQDIMVTFYSLDSTYIQYASDRFATPNEALASLVERVSSVLNSLFYVLEIGIMALALILVIFIPVFLYKLVKYFAKRNEQ